MGTFFPDQYAWVALARPCVCAYTRVPVRVYAMYREPITERRRFKHNTSPSGFVDTFNLTNRLYGSRSTKTQRSC